MNSSFLPETNWVDIIVVIFLVRGGYIGLSRGFSAELFQILGAVASAVLSLLYYETLGQWLTSHSFLSLQIANFLSFLFLLLTLLFVFRTVRILLFKILHLELFFGWEKWGGLILGVARSVVFASLFLFVLLLLPVQYIKESIEERSLSGPYIKEIAPKAVDFIVQFKPKPKNSKEK